MRPEVVQPFWAALQAGEFITDAAARVGTYRKKGARWLAAAGGVRPRRGRNLQGRCLSFAEREDIALGRAAGESMRSIAARLGRSPSTISRELGRNSLIVGGYRASTAHALAYERAGRPKPAKLLTNLVLRGIVERDLAKRYSPEQIAGRLRLEYPDNPEMRVSHETIYLSLFVQSKGLLNKELTRELRSGRVIRRAGRVSVRGQGRGQIVDAVHISERPAEADDRAVPGHWEGDMLSGSGNTHIATLVERTSRFVLLVKLENKTTDAVVAALTAQIQQLPEELKRSLTWDRGLEMAKHKQFTVDTGVQVFFCDPKSPWQRGTNENTNGLLRQYLPHGMNLREVTQEQLNDIAARLNGRPRKTLGYMPPSRKLSEVMQ
jgi:transposase, IS30 family